MYIRFRDFLIFSEFTSRISTAKSYGIFCRKYELTKAQRIELLDHLKYMKTWG